MKKLLVVALLMFPFLTNAQVVAFNSDLHYGSTGTEVVALQEFLIDQGVFTGTATGNFYSLTLAAVKRFQKAEGITPVSGYVGPITRGVINGLLAIQAPDSELNATTTQQIKDFSTPAVTPNIPPVVVTPSVSQEDSPQFTGVVNTPSPETTCTLTVTPVPNKNTVALSWVTQNATQGTAYYFNGTIAAGVKQYDKLVVMEPIASSSFVGASPNYFKAVVQPGDVTCYASSN